jgi:triosephosphate isomerase (TIM)
MKKPIFAANWKCNLDSKTVDHFMTASKEFSLPSGHLIFFGSTCFLPKLTPHQHESLWIGAQDVSTVEKGAFTGEVAAFQLKSIGVKIVLVGHSERRHLFSENSDLLTQKLAQLKAQDIPTCFCVGEKEEERKTGKTLSVVQDQLKSFVSHVQSADSKSQFFMESMVAYEPVWAIGTGKTATSVEIQETHIAIKKMLKSEQIGHCPLLYGGSVQGANAAEILKTQGVDGVLVGGASNEPKSFDAILKAI